MIRYPLISKLTTVAAIVLVTLLAPSSVAAGNKNLLTNPGFESDTIFGRLENWRDNSSWADLDVSYVLETRGAHAGRSQKIVSRRYSTGAIQFVHSNIYLKQGRQYEIKIWMKGYTKSPVEILVRKRGKPYTTYLLKQFSVTPEWREYRFSAVPGTDVQKAYFMISFKSTGELWIDDVSLVDVTDSVVVNNKNRGNLVVNGSFEAGLDRWGVKVRSHDIVNEMPVAFLNRRPYLDSGKAKLGTSSLRLNIPDSSYALITSTYFIVNPRKHHTLSLWMAANKETNVDIHLEGGSFGDVAGPNRWTRKISSEWKLYTFSTKLLPTPDNTYFIRLKIHGGDRVWIDGVQLREGSYKAFEPHTGIELGIIKDTGRSIYKKGDEINFEVVAAPSVSAGARLLVRSVDYYGNSIDLMDKELSLTAGKPVKLGLSHPSGKYGYYRIIAKVFLEQKLVDQSQVAIGIVADKKNSVNVDSPFGNHVSFDSNSIAVAKDLGVKWVRMHPPHGTKWFVVEASKGRYRYFDEEIKKAKEAGLNILGLLGTSPGWASSAAPGIADKGNKGFRSYPPSNIKDWENYVYSTVSHYKGVIDHWEIWNEPDSNHFFNLEGDDDFESRASTYMKLLKSAYQQARRANANAIIVAGCPSITPLTPWVEAILKKGAYNYLDVLSYHTYGGPGPQDTNDLPADSYIQKFRSLLKKYGKESKPIWLTESGILDPGTGFTNIREVNSRIETSAVDAPVIVVRDYVYLLSIGVSKWFYYQMNPAYRSDRRNATGFFEWDGSVRPLAVAYAALSGIIDGATFSKRLDLGSELSGYEFRAPEYVVDVVWRTEWVKGKNEILTIPDQEGYNQVAIYDLMGNKIAGHDNSKEIVLSVDREPRYIVFK